MSMQLCLVNNNPISTVLVTPDGVPLFSIETLPTPHNAIESHVPTVSCPKAPTSMTRIKRLEPYRQSTGHTETEIGVIEYQGRDHGCRLQLSADNHSLVVPPHCDTHRTIEESTGSAENDSGVEEGYRENSWEFASSNSERYVWKMFAHTPVLISASNSIMPVARYRRAKIGIVSRSRRAFLEIFPAGLAIIDLVVVTFVAFMKQRILIDSATPPRQPPSTRPPPAPSGATPEIPQLSVFEPRHKYAFSPPAT